MDPDDMLSFRYLVSKYIFWYAATAVILVLLYVFSRKSVHGFISQKTSVRVANSIILAVILLGSILSIVGMFRWKLA